MQYRKISIIVYLSKLLFLWKIFFWKIASLTPLKINFFLNFNCVKGFVIRAGAHVWIFLKHFFGITWFLSPALFNHYLICESKTSLKFPTFRWKSQIFTQIRKKVWRRKNHTHIFRIKIFFIQFTAIRIFYCNLATTMKTRVKSQSHSMNVIGLFINHS